jgi:urea-proton symporter
MLSGNLIAILSSAFIHYVWSVYVDPQEFDFADLEKHLTLVEQDLRGLTDAEKDPVLLDRAERWIVHRGYTISVILILIWPLLSVPAGVFSKAYFSFWVLLSVAWGFGAALTMFVLPLMESSEEICSFFRGIFRSVTGKDFNSSESILEHHDHTPTTELTLLAPSESPR